MKINKVNEFPKLITPKKSNMKNNKPDINDIDELLLKDEGQPIIRLNIFLIN
uniref:Uncharacterized protein n=1 Tax=viral metagenome TaxID=1070528 RepID=A0A6C0H8I5_9ZZZZ